LEKALAGRHARTFQGFYLKDGKNGKTTSEKNEYFAH